MTTFIYHKARKLIRSKNVEWKFKIVFGYAIFLDEPCWWAFQDFCNALLDCRKNTSVKALYTYFDYRCSSRFKVPWNQKPRFAIFGQRNEYYRGTG